MQAFVQKSLIQLLCRITKLGWFDDPQHQEIMKEITKFLQATIDHCISGLQILNQLVSEINLPTPGNLITLQPDLTFIRIWVGRTLTQHRKTATSFRDHSLFEIFQIALTTLNKIKMKAISGSPEQTARISRETLTLTVRCLSFDFIGTNPDESAEDVGAVQIPSAWRALIQEPATLQLLFDLYASQPTGGRPPLIVYKLVVQQY